MNKRIKFLTSIALIFAVFVSSFILPTASYTSDAVVSTSNIFLVNLDTGTAVYSVNPDGKYYAGYLSELMTFLTAYELIDDPDNTKFKVDKEYISQLPNSDGCLNPFFGQELSAKELMGIMLISSGNDAAFVLADLASGGDRDAFVAKMNEKAKSYGMKDTGFVSPGYDPSPSHVTTCRDLYRLYLQVLKVDLYTELVGDKQYIPESLYIEGYDAHNVRYTVYPDASVLNLNSPFYFKYVDTAKYSFSEATKASIVLTSSYHDKHYMFIGLNGVYDKETNVFSDARKLLTWAYLNLTDVKLFDERQEISSVNVDTGWGDYRIPLYPPRSVVKTLPNTFSMDRLQMTLNTPPNVNTPLKKDETVGFLRLAYDGEDIGSVWLTTESEEGLGMLRDGGRFAGYVYSRLTPFSPPAESAEPTTAFETEPVAAGATER